MLNVESVFGECDVADVCDPIISLLYQSIDRSATAAAAAGSEAEAAAFFSKGRHFNGALFFAVNLLRTDEEEEEEEEEEEGVRVGGGIDPEEMKEVRSLFWEHKGGRRLTTLSELLNMLLVEVMGGKAVDFSVLPDAFLFAIAASFDDLEAFSTFAQFFELYWRLVHLLLATSGPRTLQAMADSAAAPA